jgi:transcriptional regulator with XRE-family HTH domain
MDVRKLVGMNFRHYRLAAGLSQEEVAVRMGVDRAYVSGLETGRRNPTVVTLWLASTALEIGLHQLLQDRPDQDAVE